MLSSYTSGDYSAERLLELQRNTNRLPSSTPAANTSQAAAPPAFKLSGSFKQAGAGAAAPEVRTVIARQGAPQVCYGHACGHWLQAAARTITHTPGDPDDEMPLPPPARPATRPPLPPSAPAHAGTKGLPQGAEGGPGFEAPDADTIR